MKNIKNKNGFTIIEILIAISIFAIFSTGVFYLSLDTIERDSKTTLSSQALLYAQEGIEAVRNIRDTAYLSLTNGDHGLDLASGSWTFVPAPETVDTSYARTITIEDVYRDINGDIASEGTIFDPETKKITAEVTWNHRGIIPKSTSLISYMSNWRGDDWIQTTCDEFDEGTYSGIITETQTSPPVNNCGIVLELIESESEFFASSDLGKHGNDVVVDGNYAYVASNGTNNGMFIVDVSDPSNPSITSNLNVTSKGRYINKDGNYVYIGIQNSSKGLTIGNVSNPSSPSVTTTQNVGAYGNEAEVSGNYLYMGVDDNDDSFLVYDISSKGSPAEVDSIDFSDGVQVIELNGNYAYVGLDDDHDGLRVVDISTPTNVSEVASLDVGEEVNAIIISGSLAYIGTEDSSNSLRVIDISTPTNPSELTSIDVGGEIQDLTISEGYLYAAIDTQNAGLAAINISNPYNPTLSYNLDIAGKGEGIDSDDNYIYIATDTANRGLVIIGTTTSGVTTSGTYQSPAFDTRSSDTLYNFIEWDHVEVPGSTVRFQIRTASSEAGLTSATWVGSEGTNDTYYENPRTQIVTSPSASGIRYIQYKGYLDSDGISTPTVISVRINYTP